MNEFAGASYKIIADMKAKNEAESPEPKVVAQRPVEQPNPPEDEPQGKTFGSPSNPLTREAIAEMQKRKTG